MSYTDALLQSAASATQSGINTVDLNRISTYQQIFLYLGSMITNPIVIHSSVVFIRLHWFEKRFQHVVREAKMLRRTRSRSRSRAVTVGADDQDVNNAEMGVRGRKITVVRNSEGEALGHCIEPNKQRKDSNNSTEPNEDSQSPNDSREEASNTTEQSAGVSAASTPHGDEHHITFVENQRKQSRTLRIPSPREFDRGGVPEAVEDTGHTPIQRIASQPDDRKNAAPLEQQASPTQHITIDEPNITRSRRVTTFPGANSRPTTGHGPTDVEEPTPEQRRRTRRRTFSSLFSTQNGSREAPYLSWEPTIGRNSAFVALTEEQKAELGGIEYRALKTLASILIGYFFFFHMLGIVCLVPWILHTHWGKFVTDVGVGRPWWAVFISGSAFNDQGFALTPNSLASFYNAIFPLLLMTFLIVIGNTGFPCMLRFVIWVLWKAFPEGTAIREELHFLLDHPRRCFTLLFPSSATWWLFWVLVMLNGTDLILFIILDLNDRVVSSIPGGIRFVDGLFQAVTTRTAGLTVLSITDLHPAVQVSYMIMMYISVYPIAISLRRTNVYEEKSLGIYSNIEELEDHDPNKEPSYVGSHLRRQLGFDIWYIFLGLFIIAVVEGTRLQKDPGFTLFGVLFEIVSAYGTVGLSLGYPNTNTALSAQFKVISKLVIVAMMIRGRHRGLPYQLDRAVLLPSETLREKELQDAAMQMRRRSSAQTGVAASSRRPSAVARDASGATTGWQHGASDGPWSFGGARSRTVPRLPVQQEDERP
ncbi:low affinity potassium transporter [Emydomyces testavorans]|uniref:Potassium transport protein n=1 Tax=Emydomyces testavorans TaxID=2070801 RepID=A0AAF0DCX1_9EURO|nr:low affinity potassium transporter [Emydomyces testavorans]